MLRLFARGQREEQHFVELLRMIGCDVKTHDDQGQQFHFKEPKLGGHLAGSIDGLVLGLPEAPKTWHVAEFKTHNDDSFKKLVKQGVREAKFEHFAQMQLYMLWTGLDRALYLAVNKNDDSLYSERVAFDEICAEGLVAKAKAVIEAQEPLSKLHADPTWWQCKLCDFHALCHQNQLPEVTCRSCLHATPISGDHLDAHWTCARWGDANIPLEEQRKAHSCHRYLPALIPWADACDVNGEDVAYQLVDGRTFSNGEQYPAYLSVELKAIHPEAIGKVDDLRETFDARVVAHTLIDDDFQDDVPF